MFICFARVFDGLYRDFRVLRFLVLRVKGFSSTDLQFMGLRI